MTDLVMKLGWGGALALLILAAMWMSGLGKFGPGLSGAVLSAGFAAIMKAREKLSIGHAAIIGAPGVAGGAGAAFFMG